MAESFNWLRFRFPSVSGIPVFVTAFSPVLRLVQFLSSGHRSVIVKVKFSELEAGCLNLASHRRMSGDLPSCLHVSFCSCDKVQRNF